MTSEQSDIGARGVCAHRLRVRHRLSSCVTADSRVREHRILTSELPRGLYERLVSESSTRISDPLKLIRNGNRRALAGLPFIFWKSRMRCERCKTGALRKKRLRARTGEIHEYYVTE